MNARVMEWTVNDIECYIMDYGHYCGYCRFPTRPVIEQGYDGILTYVPVHGGITYAQQRTDGKMTYGFDCDHAGDDANPLTRDLDWLRQEVARMIIGIQVAAAYEKDYLLAATDEAKAKVIDAYHEKLADEYGIRFNLSDNLMSMIHMLFGKL